MKPEHVITRFPPSPTGLLHIGGVRTALFNYLFAAHNRGVMYLRFEDTDKERNKKEFEDDIINALEWVGIPYDNADVPRQSQRTDMYKKHLEDLVAKELAYEAEAGKDNPDKKVVRFKNPNTTIAFSDMVRGEVSFETKELGDFVIARSMDEPLYHLAVVIDDHDMGVTHVIRGEEHISNTPRQILILEALGFTRPHYAHIPLILAPDKSKLSKRHGAVSANEYRAQGYLPEALINYLALLGWNPGGEQELFSLEELAGLFSLERVHKAGAVFDIEKLKWFNHEYLKSLSDNDFISRLHTFANERQVVLPPYFEKGVPFLKAHSETLLDALTALSNGEYSFFLETITYDPALLLQGAKTNAEDVKKHLQKVLELITSMPRSTFTGESVKELVFPYATEQGRASVLWPLRVALSGKEKSPDPFTLCESLGREKTLERIEKSLKML